jgi:GNAT superfamily N-acetyltransferase
MSKNSIPFSIPYPSSSSLCDVSLLTGEAWLDKVQALHESVRQAVVAEKTGFLMPRSAEHFADLLAHKTGFLFGLVMKGELVAMTALVFADSFAKAGAEGSLTCPDDKGELKALYQTAKIGVIQSLCVLDTYKQKGFAGHLIQAAALFAQEKGCAHVFAQAATHNGGGVRQFLKNGFLPVAEWCHGHDRYLFHRGLDSVANDQAAARAAARRA